VASVAQRGVRRLGESRESEQAGGYDRNWVTRDVRLPRPHYCV